MGPVELARSPLQPAACSWLAFGALVRRLALTAAPVGVGGTPLAIGGAGLIAWVLQAVKGAAFVTVPFPPGAYTKADCARWLAGDPGTHSCVTAIALPSHAGDFVLQAAAVGAARARSPAGAYLALRWQRWLRLATMTALLAGSAEALGVALAALAAAVCLSQAHDSEMVHHGIGAGHPWSLALAAAVTAIVFTLGLPAPHCTAGLEARASGLRPPRPG